jgi:hypothetical protein
MSDFDINDFPFGVGVERSEQITESGVEVRVYSRTSEGQIELLRLGGTYLVTPSMEEGNFYGRVLRSVGGLFRETMYGGHRFRRYVTYDGVEVFEPVRDEEPLSWKIEYENGRLVVREGDDDQTVYSIEQIELLQMPQEVPVNDEGDHHAVVQHIMEDPHTDAVRLFRVARFELNYDPMDTPSWWHPRSVEDIPGLNDRLTQDDNGTIVAFTIVDGILRPSFTLEEFDGNAEWVPLYMPDQEVREDEGRWYMYHDWVLDGRVTLSDNIPDDLPPLPCHRQ